jgi:N-ethylmaleimide reductase
MEHTEKSKLFFPYQLGNLQLPNRIIMSALTRARADNADMTPTEMHAVYYTQRASAGLILTESVWVSKQAVGFLNIPGIYTEAQINSWKGVTKAVHEKGGRIFIQLAHSGAVSHPHYFDGELPFGPSAINPGEQVFIPAGFTATLTPSAYTPDGIKEVIAGYRQAALNAKTAGFDGIELHAQLFTLIPQFLSPATNQRTDDYGGSIENRSRILFEILEELIRVFPGKKVGIKFTPAAFNKGIIQPDEYTVTTFQYILGKLSDYDLAFIELVGPGTNLQSTPIAIWQEDYFGWFRSNYTGTIMANLGFDCETGNRIIAEEKADLVSFGLPFIANPDLVERFQNAWPLAVADRDTFYTGGEKGYTDYSNYN